MRTPGMVELQKSCCVGWFFARVCVRVYACAQDAYGKERRNLPENVGGWKGFDDEAGIPPQDSEKGRGKNDLI